MNSRLGLVIAAGCSLFLSILTLLPPIIPTDWARLNAANMSIQPPMDYAWPSYGVQAVLWLGIVGGLWVAVNGRFVIKRVGSATVPNGHNRRPYHGSPPHLALWMVAMITLIGFGLRVYTLDKLPLIIDEIGFAAHASDILGGQHVPIFAPGHNANPSAYSWLVAWVMSIFGQNRFAMRLIPLVFGTMTIPAIYILGRAWWGRRTGLLAAAFLATYPAHIFFSRMSMYNIVDPFFSMLALAMVAKAVERESHRSSMLAGLFAGVAQYFYHGSRLVVILLAVFVVVAMARKRSSGTHRHTESNVGERIFRRATWAGVVWMGAAFGLVTLPRFAPMLVGGLPVTGNAEPLRLPADLAANSLRAALAWVGQADVSPFWLSDAPLLLWGALIAFGVGVIFAFRRVTDPRYAVLILSIFLTTILGGMIWAAAPLYIRYMTAVPAIALLVALGMAAITRWLSATITTFSYQHSRRARQAMCLLIIGLICGQGIYAAMLQPDEAMQRITASQWMEESAAQEAASLPEGPLVIAVPPEFNTVQEITLAHAIAAYGERRAVVLSHRNGGLSEAQTQVLNEPYWIVRPNTSRRE